MKKFLTLSAFLFLCACGFSPIYGTHPVNGDTAVALNNVSLGAIPDRDGQVLRNHLIDRMYLNGRPQNPTTRLNINLASTETSLGIQKDATTTRQEHNLTANYTLFDLDDKVLLQGTARSIVGYNKLDAQYATVSGKNDAATRAVNEVAEQIVNRLALYFAEYDPIDDVHKAQEIEKAKAEAAAKAQSPQ